MAPQLAPFLSEVWDQGDDWTGVTSAKERRKRQNRIHQRAYRESGAQQEKESYSPV